MYESVNLQNIFNMLQYIYNTHAIQYDTYTIRTTQHVALRTTWRRSLSKYLLVFHILLLADTILVFHQFDFCLFIYYFLSCFHTSWKTLRVDRSGWNLVGRISPSLRYVTDITGSDPLSLGELGGGGGNLEKLEKWGICSLWTGDQILMKFDI